MPTLVNTTPDSYNIDYYFAHYSDCHGVGFIESDSSKFHVLAACFDPQEYDPSKNRHYMHVPQQLQTATCLCNNYYTTFTSQKFKYPEASRPSTPTEPTSLQPISNLSRKLFNKSNLLP